MIPQGSSEELRAGFWQTATRNRLVVREVGSTQRKAAHLNTQEVVKPLLSEHDFVCFASARQKASDQLFRVWLHGSCSSVIR